jgi:hypothetical protein
MNRTWCERESDVVQCLRTGSLSHELHDHVLSCVVCAEARSAAQVMLQTASLLRVEDDLPTANAVWSLAQARKREIALKRATRPLIFMRALSVVYVIFSAAWFLHYFWHSNFMELLADWNVFEDEATCIAAAIAVLSIVIGAAYLLHDSRRSAERAPST